MNRSRDKVRCALNHQNAGSIPVDFGSTAVTGIHCRIVEALRNYYGLAPRPVKIVDAFQMLGEIDAELAEKIGVDCIGIGGPKDIFDLDTTRMHEQTTPWGQRVLVPEAMDLTPDMRGDVYVYAGGDQNYPPSAVMPKGCYFINAIERQQPIEEDRLDPEDNVEEFGLLTENDLAYYCAEADKAYQTGRAVVASFGGTALGDVAFVPGMGLKQPKGIRSVVEWYMSTAMRQDYLHQVFEKEIDIAIANYEKLWAALGDKIDVYMTDDKFLRQVGKRKEPTRYIIDDMLEVEKADAIYKVYVAIPKEDEEKLTTKELVGHLRFEPEYLMFQPDNKRGGIIKMMEHLNADIKDVVVFGDDYNDMDMFCPEWFSIAMGNACQDLKDIANYVTDSNVDDGIKNACEHFGWI